VTDAPIAQTIHPGNGVPAGWRRELIAEWMTANGVDADNVSADHPITVLTVPYRNSTADGEGPWLIQVIAFTQYYRRPDGTREHDLISQRPVSFQRTVPLTVPFPTDPKTDGEDRGQADRQAAQEAPEVQVRPAGEAPVSDRYEIKGQERTGEGRAKRIEGHPEDHPRQGHQALSEPEEDRREEEVGNQ
jgi:hypothetical protein